MPKKHQKMLIALLLYLPLGFLTLLILMNFYLGINKAITRNPVPKVWGFAPLIVLSGSMEPAIYPGDVVVIRAQKAERYQLGDIVTYREGQTVFTHRIVGAAEGLLVLKGDNNNTVDDAIRPEQLEGKVLLTIPKIGRALVFLKRPPGLAVLALLVLLYVFAEDLYTLVKKGRRRGSDKRGGEG